MGTRSTYRVINQYKSDKGGTIKEKLCLVYLQFDGYPEGHPQDTAKWLASGKVVNGIGSDDSKLIFNGAGCLAAQLIARLKSGPGGTYIYPVGSRGRCWDQYSYDIIVNSDTQTIKFVAYEVDQVNNKPVFNKLFSGTPEEFYQKYKE